MLTPSWESSGGALAALLNSIDSTELVMADLYTITLAGGAVLRYTSNDVPLTVNGNTFQLGPILKRGPISLSLGISVDTLSMQLSADESVQVSGVPMITFLTAGGFSNARLMLERLFANAAGMPVGTLISFTGRVASITGGRHEKTIEVKSDTELLDVMIPRDVYQPGCKNTLFDPRCGLNRATYAASTAASSVSNALRTSFGCTLTGAIGRFDLGVAACTSGANVGVTRTIKAYTVGGQLVVSQRWPFAVAAGDAFTVYPGCDKTQATCTSKFGNVVNFRGEPYIPAPETIT